MFLYLYCLYFNDTVILCFVNDDKLRKTKRPITALAKDGTNVIEHTRKVTHSLRPCTHSTTERKPYGNTEHVELRRDGSATGEARPERKFSQTFAGERDEVFGRVRRANQGTQRRRPPATVERADGRKLCGIDRLIGPT